MSKVCQITGKKPVVGNRILRKGLAKKKGGIGRHVTAVNRRRFEPNLQRRRLWVPELKRFVVVRLTARGLRTLEKKGVYKGLLEAGLI
ncbi:MAG: 50S ribosomal protein L28 [Verrucomicrobiota bacterium]|jgi:large subunit ribosomal protein L28|nr:50S ribosomal protein L28 [Verrucomicrobiota bacterium]MDD8047810.1 50S ribosomal protein L28 [Verrucomicrobiota bacterium]MDD8050503.1 50S ribosomal protein L28 [Verrucomicrobiota bacterium]HCF96681.1 50S ribosomal protein L28 [Verrucomicrobiota bacterium]